MSENEEIITTQEFLEQQKQLEKAAKEILPGNFDKCTYNLGRLNQPIYACLTCIKPGEMAGFCYPCSISCHADHELLELFNKRDFLCECGTNKYKTCCSLWKVNGFNRSQYYQDMCSSKPQIVNNYNHNFLGRYCFCDKIYNPEVEVSDMIQCFICYDWFHDKCIGEVPECFEDFICYLCLSKNEFLKQIKTDKLLFIEPKYTLQEKTSLNNHDSVKSIISNEDKYSSDSNFNKRSLDEYNTHDINKRQRITNLDPTNINENKENSIELFDEAEFILCSKVNIKKNLIGKDFNVFGIEGWKNDICCCASCRDEFMKNNVLFLIKNETIYDLDEDSDSDSSSYEAGLKALSRLPREKAIEVALAIDKMRDEFKEFVKPFIDSGNVITEKDVENFIKSIKRKDI